MRKLVQIFVLLSACSICTAQIPSGYVQTVATVSALANGSYGASWTNLSSSPQLGLLGCVSTFQTTVSGAFNAYGKISVLLADTAQICPSPSTWTFNFTFACSTGQTPSTFQIQVAVTGGGGTEDISSQITAALPATSCSGGGGGGGGNLSGSGTAGFIPLWTGLHALGNSPADYNVTTPSAFTFPYRVDVGGVPTFAMNLGPLSTMTASWNLDTTTPATALASLGATQSANTVWAGPCSGSPGTPSFRALCAADITGLITGLSYQTVAANGTAQTQRPTLNFSPRFNVTDSSSPAETNVDFAATGITAGTYSNPTIIFDAYGRATSAVNGSSVLGNLSASDTYTNAFTSGQVNIPVGGIVAGSGTVSNFFVSIAGPGVAQSTITFTVYHNGSPTSITCAITTSATTCNDTTHSFSASPGDTLTIYAVFSGSGFTSNAVINYAIL